MHGWIDVKREKDQHLIWTLAAMRTNELY